jgi:hypothetical protein
VVASHYAEPVARVVKSPGPLLGGPESDADVIGEVAAGDSFELVDDSRGWAWGYAGSERMVGYLPSEAVG